MNPGVQALEKPPGPQGPPPGDGGGRPGSGGDGALPAAPALNPARIGVWLLVGAITILFMAFTSTFLVRRSQTDWRIGPLPPILWASTAALIASSVALERARAGARRHRPSQMRSGMAAATMLGIVFVAGQVVAWRELAGAGIFMASNPHASFFYLLTGIHGLHVAGGVGALLFAWGRVGRLSAPGALDLIEPTATYWHFVDGLWLYLFAILFWR